MKWVFPAACGGLVLALAVSFPRAQDTAIEKAPAKEGTGGGKTKQAAADEAAPDAPAKAGRSRDRAKTDADAAPKSPAGDRVGGKPADVAKDAPKSDDADGEFKIFHLRQAYAPSARKVIMDLYAGEFGSGNLSITADSRTNSLLLRGPRGLLSTVEAVLVTLDDSETTAPNNTWSPEVRRNGKVAKEEAPPWDQHATEYRQHEEQAASLAAAYRNQQTATPSDKQRLDRLRTELQEAVRAAFDARQKLQRAEMDRLRGRLVQIERQIDSRQQRAQEIIDNRINELLHPEKQWESGDDANGSESTTLPTDRQQSRRRRVGERPVREGPRDAESAVAAARAAVAQADKALAVARDKADLMSRLEKKGYAKAAVKDAALAELAAQEIRQKQALADLEQAEKQAALVRDGEPRDERSLVSFMERQGTPLLRESAANPRKALLDAEMTITTARATAAQAEMALLQARKQLNRVRELPDGAVPKKELYSAEAEVDARELRRTQALADLEQAERQAALAREDLAAQIDLLKIDLDDASLRFEQASRVDARARTLQDRGAISSEESDQIRLALEHARLQFQRAKTLYDLYRKALPRKESAGSKSSTKEDPATRLDTLKDNVDAGEKKN